MQDRPMNAIQKSKRRGFVMTGGGAKGLYEAGVIHAFHITGMEFDVITGSSIGAFNSIFYAEYLLHKRMLPMDIRQDPERAVEAMDNLVRAYHHAWLQMPDKKIIDDSETGPLGKLKDDLLDFDVSLPQLTRLVWWWTNPEHGVIPPPEVWPALISLISQLAGRLGGAGQLLRIFKDHRQGLVKEALRTFLHRFDMDKSLVPPSDDQKLKTVFTEPVTPLRPEHLQGKDMTDASSSGEALRLVDPNRTLREYAEMGIDVRLTRANYRTGRLEISSYLSERDFMAYLERQAWRLQAGDPQTLPLGSFRLQLPGDPIAINAALASGRFPGVFLPYPLTGIYALDRPENKMLRLLVSNWLDDPELAAMLSDAYQAVHPDQADDPTAWQRLLESWRASSRMREFFPGQTDMYVDGGSIDNTPSNSAVDATREWADRNHVPRRDLELDLYIVLLHTEPKVSPDEVQEPTFYQVVKRTLDIQSAAKLSSDAVVVDTINTVGQRAEELAETVQILVDGCRKLIANLDDAQKLALQERLRQVATEREIRGYQGKTGEGILERMEAWGKEMLASRLPLQVNAIKVYPSKMALDTLQFTERLGFRQESAVDMITMGCYNTLWTLRQHLEKKAEALDGQDMRVLAMARKWMGGGDWPRGADEQDPLASSWQCQRTACVFYAQYCSHGQRKTHS